MAGQFGWPGLKQVCRIERITRKKGKQQTTEIAYAITSLSPERGSAEALLSYNRGHWGIENRLHWVRDVTLGEDKCRANVGHSPQNLAALRNLSLTLLRLAGIEGVASALRDFASRPYDLLDFLCIINN